jgi:predicted DNA-binding transcriptional regulator AlpA
MVAFYQIMHSTTTRLIEALPIGSAVVSPEDLVSVSDVATMLDIAPITAHRYTLRLDFPEPLGKARGGRVWLRSDVQAWAKQALPLKTGRPPKRDSRR